MVITEYCIGRHGTEPLWVKDQVMGQVHARADRNEQGMLLKLVLLADADPVIAQLLMTTFPAEDSHRKSKPNRDRSLVLFERTEEYK